MYIYIYIYTHIHIYTYIHTNTHTHIDSISDECDDGVERLLGMDMVRLVLERAKTSREAVDVAAKLLETHGQVVCMCICMYL